MTSRKLQKVIEVTEGFTFFACILGCVGKTGAQGQENRHCETPTQLQGLEFI